MILAAGMCRWVARLGTGACNRLQRGTSISAAASPALPAPPPGTRSRDLSRAAPHPARCPAPARSSSIAQFAAYPLALTRTRLQAQGIGGRPIKYAGMCDVLRKTVQNEGVRGLYKVRAGQAGQRCLM